MLMFVIEDQPHRAGTNLRRKLVACLLAHGSTFSRVGASGKPGAVHTIPKVPPLRGRHDTLGKGPNSNDTTLPKVARNPGGRKMLKFALGLIALLGTASAGLAQEMTVTTPDALKWGPAPPVLPKGAQLAVLSGDPGANGPYVVRVKLPSGYTVPAHNHPTTENVTVISGTFNIGMGDKLD